MSDPELDDARPLQVRWPVVRVTKDDAHADAADSDPDPDPDNPLAAISTTKRKKAHSTHVTHGTVDVFDSSFMQFSSVDLNGFDIGIGVGLLYNLLTVLSTNCY